ncbi:hypothetical protein ACTHQ4_02410 [Alkalicoccobacillus gibsonii]|uniref:hypothetical protein n=1 Tax=Alkalicoccobacillus gibsonii TaxID=79881 RepID=UPI003F7BAD40
MKLKQNIDEILKTFDTDIDIPEIPIKRNYWLVRTDSGVWYEEFSNNDFIAIGWDKVNEKKSFSLDNRDEAYESIIENYPESSPGHIFGALNRFKNDIKIGDIVMIPSEKSETIRFGKVTGNEFIAEVTPTELDLDQCPYKRRRDVNWYKSVSRKQLDPQLFKMMQSHHTISNATDYSLYIDKTLNSFFIKNERLYVNFDIRLGNDLNYNDLKNFINLPEDIDKQFLDGESPLDFESKIRIQSPGDWLLMAVESGATRLLIISIIIKQFLLGGETKILGFNISNEPLLDILRRNGITFKKTSEEDIQETFKKTKDIKKSLKVEAPGENSESSDLKTDTDKGIGSNK